MTSESDDSGEKRQANVRRPRSQLNTVANGNVGDATEEEGEEPSEEGSALLNMHESSSARQEEQQTSENIPNSHSGGNRYSGSIFHHARPATSPSHTSSPAATYQRPVNTILGRKDIRKRMRDEFKDDSRNDSRKFTPINKNPSPESPNSPESTENQDSPPAKRPRHNTPAPKRKASDSTDDPRLSKKTKTGAPPPDPDDADGESSSADSTSEIDPNRPAGQRRGDDDSREAGSDNSDENMSESLSEPMDEGEDEDLSEGLPLEEADAREETEANEENDMREDQSGNGEDAEPSQDGQEDHDAQGNESKKEDGADEKHNEDQQDEESQEDEGQGQKTEQHESSESDSTEEEVNKEDQQKAAKASKQVAEPVRKSSRTGTWMYDDGTSKTNQDIIEQIAKDAARDVMRGTSAASQGVPPRVTRQQVRALSAQPQPPDSLQPAPPKTKGRAESVRPATAPDRSATTGNRAATRGKTTARGGRNPRQQSQPPRSQASRGSSRSGGLRGRGAHGVLSRIYGAPTASATRAPQDTTVQDQGTSSQPREDTATAVNDTRNNALPSVEDRQEEADEASHYEDAPEVPHQQGGDSRVTSSQFHQADLDNRMQDTLTTNALESTSDAAGSRGGRRPSRFIAQPREDIRHRPGNHTGFPPFPPMESRPFNPNFPNLASFDRYMASDEHSSFFGDATQRPPAGPHRPEVPSSTATEVGKTQQKKQPQKPVEKAKAPSSRKEKESVTKSSKTTKKGTATKTATGAEVGTTTEKSQKAIEQLNPDLVSQDDRDKAYAIFVCGDNRLGQLALGDHVKEAQIPVINERLTAYELKDFDCGSSHCIALTRGGTVLTWGLGAEDNLALGQESWEPDSLRKIPQPVNLTKYTEHGDEIIQVVATNDASFALTREGKVLGWGCFKHPDPTAGPLRRLRNTYSQPKEIKSMRKIAMLAAGGQHLLALNTDGAIFAMGWNHRGQHGIDPERHDGSGDFDDVAVVEAFDKGKLAKVRPARIACGEHTSYLIDTKGKLYSWGDNSRSQLGNDDKGGYEHVPAHRPVVNAVGQKRRVVDVAGGVEHALACDKDGNLSAWGLHEASAFALPHSGRDGQTGQTFASGARQSSRRNPSKVPACNAVRSVAAGAYHSIVLDSRGEAFTYGVSSRYQTGQGHGNTMNIPQPEKLQEGEIRDYKVTRAAAGATFTIFAARKRA